MFENIERLLDLHAQYDVPACFAVVGAAALPGERPYHDPGQIRRVHESGHEIASHSFRHEWLPGLSHKALHETLALSKDALEQCIGARVVSFVPPYNQPFDYPRGWSFSLSERREAGRERVDLRRLCEALKVTGYRFSRVSYRPWATRLAELLWGKRLDRPVQVEHIAGITCVRLNTPGGFKGSTSAVLQRGVETGGIITVCGHPQALKSGDSQDEKWLVPFLNTVKRLQQERLLEVCLPRDLIQDN